MGSARDALEKKYAIDRLTETCPYLPDRRSSLVFLNAVPIGVGYRRLLDEGYRRSGLMLYRPDCGACRECKILRVPVTTFRRSKSQRRVWNRCADRFRIEVTRPRTTREKVTMYQRYLEDKHGSTRRVTEDEYSFFFTLTSLGELTREIQFYDGDRLVAVGIADCFDDALSSVYFYWDPRINEVSPGTFSALAEIELAKQWGMDYYYLGYYIAGCRTMNYKSRFQPCEIRVPGESAWKAPD